MTKIKSIVYQPQLNCEKNHCHIDKPLGIEATKNSVLRTLFNVVLVQVYVIFESVYVSQDFKWTKIKSTVFIGCS